MFFTCRFLPVLVCAVAILTVGCDSSRFGGSQGHSSTLVESSEAEFRAKIDQPGLVLAKFGAPWCPPCREVDRELASMSDSQAEIITINVDNESGLAREYQVSSIPRLMLFQNGSKVKDHVGYADRDEIQGWIRAASRTAESEIQLNPLVES